MANLGPAPKAQFFDTNGQPLVGGKVYTYAAGTTTPLATYTDASEATFNANPIILDGRGECNIWFAPASTYKVKLTDSNDAEIYTVDNITSIGTLANGTVINSSILNSSISNSAITGSLINATVIGGTTPAAGYFTTITGNWDSLPSGTRLVFAQTAAPTGWTKIISENDKALRVVSGTAGSGGSVPFTTAFSSQSISGTVGSHAITVAEMPAHTHDYSFVGVIGGTSFGGTNFTTTALTGTTTSTGSGAPHTHTFTSTSINLAVQYVDVILAVKN